MTNPNEPRKAPQRRRLVSLLFISLSAALIAVCSYITIPAPVPFTLQVFGVAFALCFLGGARGTVAVLLYLSLGAIGLPVFSGFGAGFGVLFGTTGGYLWGFLLTSLAYWGLEVLARGKELSFWGRLWRLLPGLALCYAAGTIQFALLYAKAGKTASVWSILVLCVLPYLLPDLAKLALASLIAGRVKRSI